MPVTDSESTRGRISAALAGTGFSHDPHTLAIQSRGDRLAVRISYDLMAWFPANDAGRVSLTRDRRILRLLERFCRFSAPRVIYEDDAGWDLRRLVAGVV